MAVAAMLVSVQKGGCQSLYDNYDFNTGVDASLWQDMSGATTLSLSGDDNAYTSLTPIGFNFVLAGSSYQNWTVNTNGTIRLGDTPVYGSYYSTPLGSNLSHNLPKIVVLGCDGYIVSGTGYVKYKLVGNTTATRMLVIEYRLSTYSNSTRPYPVTVQVQLRQSDNSITYVFGEPPVMVPATAYQMGVAASATDIVAFNTSNHTASFLTEPTSVTNSGVWPEQYRYYRLSINPAACYMTSGLEVGNVTETSATVSWATDGGASQYSVYLDGVHYATVGTDHIDFAGFDTGSYHDVYVRRICGVNDSSRAVNVRFRTLKGYATGCIDISNLEARFVTAYYGSFENPYANEGIVDNGSGSSSSRHTMHTDTSERDYRTNNNLRTVPPGHTSSIRLGNWSTGSQAEAIMYTLMVDTAVSDLMLLNYAAVLQDPSHSAEEQPRFRLEILNSNMELIDPTCGTVDFIANSNLGWAQYGNVLYKDWTTVGVDLTPYAGQVIYVRLTTYDCSQSGHYGYAYFTIDCSRKNMVSENCGNITDNVFTAPAGFNYLWYVTSVQNPISTQQSVSVATNNDVIYHCRLSFIDNPTCNFEMSAFAGARYPLSLFDSVVTISDCQFDVTFNNRSTISTDGHTPVGTNEQCETAWWDFGNGQTSTQYHASTHYNSPGQYQVTLVSSIAGGTCLDTLTKTITLVSMTDNPPAISGIDEKCNDNVPVTLTLHNAVTSSWAAGSLTVNPTATTTYTATVTDSNGCPQTLVHTVTIHPTFDIYDSASVCVTELPYTFGSGATIGQAGTFPFQSVSSHGCDSAGVYVLVVRDTSMADTFATACDWYEWYGTTYTADSDVPQHVTLNTAGCDSTTTLRLTLLHSTESAVRDTVVENQLPRLFNGVVFHDDTLHATVTVANAAGCDSAIDYSLHVWHNKRVEADSSVCDNMLPLQWNGRTFNAAATDSAVLSTTHGADSTVVMTLHVNPTYDIRLAASICDNESYTFEDEAYTTAGDHTRTFTSSLGCDSVRTLQLQLRATSVGDTVADECDHFVWYGTDYAMSGDVAARVTTNSVGCDSTTTLHLALRHSTSAVYLDTVVENLLPRAFNGVSFADSVSHATVTIANVALCDSVIDYSLFVHWNRDTVLDSTVCNDMLPLVWTQSFGTVSVPTQFDTLLGVSATMVRTVVIPAHTGSDSTVTMRLLVHPLYDHHLNVNICDNQSFAFGDSLFMGEASHVDHTDSLHSIRGCDSLSTLHLDIWPTFDHHLYDTVCASQPYLWGTPQRVMVSPSTVTLWRHGSDTALAGGAAVVDTSFTDVLASVHTCDSLSSLHLRLLPVYDMHYRDTICDAGWQSGRSPEWQGNSYRFEDSVCLATGTYQHSHTTQTGPPAPLACDSVRTLHLKVYPSYDMHFYDTIYDGDTYSFEQAVYDTTGIYPHLLDAVFSCDSLRTLHLQRNRRTYVDTVVCQNALPLVWHHVRGSAPLQVVFAEGQGSRGAEWQTIKDSVHLLGVDDIDSLVVMTVTARDTSATYDVQHVCDSLVWRDGVTYTSSTAAPWVLLQNHWGCDSVRHLDLTVDYTHWHTDRVHACDSMRWIDGVWYYRDTAGYAGELGSGISVGPVDTLVTSGGCDSVVSLNLSMHYSVYTAETDTFCYNEVYSWHDFSVQSDLVDSTVSFYLTDTLRTVWQCDSVVGMVLTKMAKPRIEFYYDIDCEHLIYNLGVNTDVQYVFWSSDPYDPMLESQEEQRLVHVSPAEWGDYMVYVDYHEIPLCPLTSQIKLKNITIPRAQMHVTPGALSYSNLEFKAYDISEDYDERVWYVNWVRQGETSRSFEGEAGVLDDTVTVALSLFNSQCWDTVTQLLPIRKVSIFAPNVFTPSVETNSRFVLFTQGVIGGEMSIYNRDGLLVFRTNDFTGEGWNGEGCSQGNYVWKLEYHAIDYPAATQVEVGTVLLIR